MATRLVRFAFAALLAGFLAACGNQESASPVAPAGDAPDAVIKRSIDLLKQSDIAGLMQNSLPPAEFDKIKSDWGKAPDEKPITDEQRKQFADAMARLTAPDADKTIYAEIEPQLKQFDAQYQQQMPLYVGMGSGWLQGMVQQNQELTDAEKQQAMAAINALSAWVQKTRFTDPESVKKVLAIATRAARDINLKTLDEARALSYDQSMQKARIAVAAFKDALNVYGFSVDQTLDSIKTAVASNDGNAAVVKMDYSLLGTALTSTVSMVKIDGRWYGKNTIEKMKQRDEEEAAEANIALTPGTTPPPDAPPPAGSPPPPATDADKH